MRRRFHCYAEGHNGDWEAICLDLDIAVQGGSFAEVYQSLMEAVGLYLEEVAELPEADRRRLLYRKAPLAVRARFLWLALRTFLTGHADGEDHAEFTMAAPA